MNTQPIITLQQVAKTYTQQKKTVHALHPLDLTINSGEIFGIIGLSGAGKSTLLRLINLLEVPSSGLVTVAGQDLLALSKAQLREARTHMGMIFQHFNLLASRNVFDNIALPLRLAHWSEDKIVARVDELLALIGLTDKKAAYPSQLSGGQKQRVAIARALALSPKILLCDEATSALDPHTTHTILQLLQEINQKLNLTIVLITHEMEVIKKICHRVAVLDHGVIVEQGEVVDLFFHPKHAIAQQFIANYMGMQLPDSIQKKLRSLPSDDALPLLKLAFRGSSALQPLIAQLYKTCGVGANILLANMQVIQEESVGVTILLLETLASETTAIEFLRAQGVRVEVLGYVSTVY
jgi:D-methionine transport system ATP-binding protein